LEGLLAAFSFLDGIRLSLSGKEKWGRDLISACRQIKPDPNFFSHQCDTNITWS